jgi:cytochrome P450
LATELASASLLESAQFNQAVIVPNAVQGLFRRRPGPVAVATRLGVDGQAIRLMQGLRRKHGPGPIWIRVMTNRALLVLSPEDTERVLDGSPHPFASDPEAKRKGMAHFQPDALTLSRGALWANRRRFTEAVLETPKPVPGFAARLVTVAAQEIDELADDRLDYTAWHGAFRRITRRVVLGDSARNDEELSDLLAELMSEANGLPSGPSRRFAPFMERIESYVRTAEPASLVARFADAPSDPDTRAAGQVPHWLFATQDTLSINALRALALIVSHPAQEEAVRAELAASETKSGRLTAKRVAGLRRLTACLSDAMRLYPTTPLLSRETLVDLTWSGAVVPAGTQVLISNTFHHRDGERLAYADRFAPEEWIDGDAASNPAFNHFSRGPQGCPGANVAMVLGAATLATLLRRRRVRLVEPRLDPARPLPHMLDGFRLRFALEET